MSEVDPVAWRPVRGLYRRLSGLRVCSEPGLLPMIEAVSDEHTWGVVNSIGSTTLSLIDSVEGGHIRSRPAGLHPLLAAGVRREHRRVLSYRQKDEAVFELAAWAGPGAVASASGRV